MQKIVTEKCRLSYEHLWQPTAISEGQEPKFSCQLIIPKSDTACVNSIRAAIAAETAEAYPKGRPPASFRTPLKDGDALINKDGVPRKETAGCFVLNASSKTRPGIVNAQLQDIVDKSELYSGCYVRAQLAFAKYKLPTNQGIGVYINNVQKLADGPSLAGRDTPADAFSAWVEPDDGNEDL